jgi:hypothetical protein
MALVTNYSTLQAHIADTLNRSDLTAVIPNFIQQFEAQAKDDFRLRRLSDRGLVSVSADGLILPGDMYTLESWSHDADPYFGPITIVGADQITVLKARHGATGVPQFASIVAGRARFAPAPDTTYSTQMTYWQRVENLSDTVTTNWLLRDRPDIYLYGALLESAPYLKDDQRLGLWGSEYDRRVEAHYKASSDAQFGGNIGGRQYSPIGG